jgi:peptide/nickel transport system substrate-binding protein
MEVRAVNLVIEEVVPRSAGRLGKRRLTVAVGALVVAAMAMTACTPSESGTADEGSAGTLQIGLDAPVTTLDPSQLSSGGTTIIAWQALFDTLLRAEPDGTIVPNAAEAFEFNEDSTELTLTLRDDLIYSTGDVVDAASVKASLENMRDSGGSDASRLAGITVETPDEQTVVISTPEPRGLLPNFLALAPGAIADPATLDADDVATNPVGSGPYELDAANSASGSTYTFVRRDDYWNVEAYPYERIVMRVLEDQTARLSALRSGQIAATFVSPQAAGEAEAAGFDLLENEVNWAGLHIIDRDGSTVPALADVRVRQAINMVFDRQAIVDALFQGRGVVTNQIFNPGSEAYDDALLDEYAFDVDAAKQLMADAGYADGFDITIPDIAVNNLNVANPLIVQQLGLLNIRVTQESVPPAQIVTDLLGGKYPLFYFTLESRNALWDVVQALQPTSIWNIDKTEDPELAPLLAQVETARGAEGAELFQEINAEITADAWYAPWAFITDTWAFDDETTATAVLGSRAPYLYTFRPAE